MPQNLFPLDNTKKFTDQKHVGHNRWHPDVPPVVSVKPGDVFRAGFIYGMLTGLATAAVLRVGCAAAALSCTKHGAMASVPTREELDTYLVDPPA